MTGFKTVSGSEARLVFFRVYERFHESMTLGRKLAFSIILFLTGAVLALKPGWGLGMVFPPVLVHLVGVGGLVAFLACLWGRLWATAFVVYAYTALIEMGQVWMPFRAGSTLDLGLNAAAVVLGVGVVMVSRRSFFRSEG